MNHKPVSTDDLVSALQKVMRLIERKGVANCSPETQRAYLTMQDFVHDAIDGNGDSFAVVYYP